MFCGFDIFLCTFNFSNVFLRFLVHYLGTGLPLKKLSHFCGAVPTEIVSKHSIRQDKYIDR